MNDLDHIRQLIQLVESAEQSDSTIFEYNLIIPDRARKIIATYSRQSGFKSPVKPDIAAISGTPEQELLKHLEFQLVKSYTSDPKFASYLKNSMQMWIMNLKKQDPVYAKHMGFVLNNLKTSKAKQDFISNLAKKDATKYLTMYLQDTNLDHPVIA